MWKRWPAPLNPACTAIDNLPPGFADPKPVRKRRNPARGDMFIDQAHRMISVCFSASMVAARTWMLKNKEKILWRLAGSINLLPLTGFGNLRYNFVRRWLVLLLVALVLCPLPAHAYLGPGAGFTIVSTFFVL